MGKTRGEKNAIKFTTKKRQNPAPSSVRRRGGRNLVSGHKNILIV